MDKKETPKSNDEIGKTLPERTGSVPNMGPGGVLGDIAILMMGSKAHRYLFISDLEWLVLPALRLKQVRVFRNERRMLAYFSWAYLSEEAERRLLSGQGRIAPRDWKSGDRLWIIDSVVAAGNGRPFLRAMQEKVFSGQNARILRPSKDNRGWEGVLLADVLKNIKDKPVEKTH
jgi:cytolysin-activating lysine-acyltransferase